MQRVVIVGSPAAEKSYLCRDLGKLLALPIYHLDYYAWQNRWSDWRQIYLSWVMAETIARVYGLVESSGVTTAIKQE